MDIMIKLEPDYIKESDLEKYCKSLEKIRIIARSDYLRDISKKNNIITIETFYYNEKNLKYCVDFFGKKQVFSQEQLDIYPDKR